MAAALQPAEAAPHRAVVTPVRIAPVVPPSEQAKAPDASVPACDPVQPVEPQLVAASVSPAAPPLVTPNRRDSAEPLTADLSRLHVTVSRRFLEKLEGARAALSHARPGATAEEILEAGLDLVLAQQAKRKGLVENPRKKAPPVKSDRVPAHVKREVWKRDGGRCQWRLDSGGICGSTLRLEFDHVVPLGQGGSSTVENVRVLCRVHNHLAARRAYGNDWMERFTKRRDARPVETPAPP